ncbi:MAG: molybdopterin-guanine dinucleotide biosynthesis protein MobB [Anaerovoracaceae bacterium]|nr:molybdopterin-guanine dinucleotide biosynthesis protein MobB [Anaerovoracaceae bacterium]
MRIITVKGFSKTGKTTTVTSLVSELKRRGYTVGTIKDIHFMEFEADVPGTDTYRHAEAGARRVTARGLRSTSIIIDQHMDIDEILKYYKEDFLIIEGDCGIKSPTIITAKTVHDIEEKLSDDAIAVSGVISGEMAEQGIMEYGGLPVINGIEEVEKLADLAEKATKDKETKLDVELTIGGEEIWMVPFVKETLKNVVIGAVKALDGYEEGREIVVKIK